MCSFLKKRKISSNFWKVFTRQHLKKQKQSGSYVSRVIYLRGEKNGNNRLNINIQKKESLRTKQRIIFSHSEEGTDESE